MGLYGWPPSPVERSCVSQHRARGKEERGGVWSDAPPSSSIVKANRWNSWQPIERADDQRLAAIWFHCVFSQPISRKPAQLRWNLIDRELVREYAGPFVRTRFGQPAHWHFQMSWVPIIHCYCHCNINCTYATKNSISPKKNKKNCEMSINSSLCVENKKICFLKIFKKWTYTVFRCG